MTHTIFTSTFTASGMNPDAVSISLYPPLTYNGTKYPDLYPPHYLIMGHKSKEITNDLYIIEYTIQVLHKLDPKKVIEDLNNKILLCWCKKGKFCHRHLVINWLKQYDPMLITKEL